jgi:hypothetical protein
MNTESLTVPTARGKTVTALWTAAAGDAAPGWLFAYAPGAGAGLNDPFGAFASGALAAEGVATLRFQFPYAEEGRRTPDPPQLLEATWRAVVDVARPRAPRLVIGGRSMGGRIASQVVAQGTAVDALALLAYPLHPPGQPERTRDAHLSKIAVPTLFCSGTRDAFGTPDELKVAAARMPNAHLHLLEGADHGFAVPRASGRTRTDVWNECIQAILRWLPPQS